MRLTKIEDGVRRFAGACALALSGALVVGCSRRPVHERVVYVPSPTPQAVANRVAWSQPPIASASVQPGRLAGIVVDEESGQPIFSAQISVASAPLVGALTDSSGRFNLAAPSGARTIWVRRIGYAPYKVDAVLARDSGYVMVAALTRVPISLCNVSVGAPSRRYLDSTGKMVEELILPPPLSAVVVYVRDALTGHPPETPVTVTVTDGAFRDSLVATVDSLGRVPGTLAPERPGTYEVTVRNSQYRDWRSTAATRLKHECGGELVPAVFRAWLVPR